MLLETVYIHAVIEATGTSWKTMEGHREGWKAMESYGSL